MGRYEIIPNTTRFECGGNAAYGVVRVSDTEDPAHPELDVQVDTNRDDGTELPRIILPDGTSENIDNDFLSAYQDPGRRQEIARPDQQTACREMEAAGRAAQRPQAGDESWGLRWLLYPLGTAVGLGLSYYVDRRLLNDMTMVPGFREDAVADRAYVFRTVGDLLRTGTYVGYEPQLGTTMAAVSDSFYGGVGLVLFSVALAGGAGDPEMHLGLSAITDVVAARAHRHLGRGWGSLAEIGMGGLLLGLGFGGVCGGRPEVREGGDATHDPYVDPGETSPYRPMSQLPNCATNLTLIGADHISWGLVFEVFYLMSGGEESTAASSIPQIGFQPLRGGGMAGISGSF